ncbi:cytokine-inducible SH2-containing protein [Engraulis encrasicolus]|uniref:cytokine-inducible SH2-containing protein n=1 Tax=Engraulis encrasicolus TaxID=184585 RepID=UPI002FD60C2B
MILCVQSPRPILPDTPTVVPLGMSTPSCLHSAPPQWDPRKDLRAIASTFCYLETSGWYWGGMTASDAQAVLQAASEGTFLVRDSSHPLYMLTLSVRTKRGPTNVRIEYSCGRFRLDSSSPARPRLLSFPDVPSLVQHYVSSGRDTNTTTPPTPSTEDRQTQRDTGNEEQGHNNKAKDGDKEQQRTGKVVAEGESSPALPDGRDNGVLLKLRRPLCRPQSFPSLQHLTRLTINKHIDSTSSSSSSISSSTAQLPLPGPLIRYLQDYPFRL